jgi:hypothetical protein
VDALEVVGVLCAVVGAGAAAFGAWVGYLQFEDGRETRRVRIADEAGTPAQPQTPTQTWAQTPLASPEPVTDPHGQPIARDGQAVPPSPTPGPGVAPVDPSGDQWTVVLTPEVLARRATVAVGAAVLSCMALVVLVLTFAIGSAQDNLGDHTVETFINWVLAFGAVMILVATVVSIWVRRAARYRYRRPWRTARFALWLAWGPWLAAYVSLAFVPD